jgi:protein tyrosine phosphatase (PTP) superfamily phosphohydrolase (DUF442 family)
MPSLLSTKFSKVCGFALTALLLVLVLPSAAPAESSGSELLAETAIDNFQAVSDSIWRGAAPSDEAIHTLAKGGIKTIVDLRMPIEGCGHEQNVAAGLGLKYVHLPMGFTGPSVHQIVSFLRVVNDSHNQPVYVHCHQGADRTGVLIGTYRILMDNWSYQRTYIEMRQHHFKPWLLTMKKTVAILATDSSSQDLLRRLVTLKSDKEASDTALALGSLHH